MRNRKRRRRNRLLTVGLIATLALLWGVHGMTNRGGATLAKPLVTATPTGLLNHAKDAASNIRVMAVGSSVAEGWDDPKAGGYLTRTFAALNRDTAGKYVFFNKSVAGDGAPKVAAQYPKWLASVKPGIVVISWGGLDDANDKTPVSVFRAAVHAQIAEALAMHAVVMIVTPPVTRASYTQYRVQEPMYLNAEMDVARSFHNSNVQVFDVFDQMKSYLTAHGQTYVPYMGDGWHPNTRGHILAGDLLTADITAHYGKSPIRFHA